MKRAKSIGPLDRISSRISSVSARLIDASSALGLGNGCGEEPVSRNDGGVMAIGVRVASG